LLQFVRPAQIAGEPKSKFIFARMHNPWPSYESHTPRENCRDDFASVECHDQIRSCSAGISTPSEMKGESEKHQAAHAGERRCGLRLRCHPAAKGVATGQ